MNVPKKNFSVYKLPWYTPGLKKLKNLRNKFYKVYKSTNSDESKQMHEHYSREFAFLNKFLYKQYIINFESKINNNPKSFWKFIRSKQRCSDYPSAMFFGDINANTPEDQANLFANFFKSNFQVIDSNAVDQNLLNTVHSVIDLGLLQLTESEIESGLMNLKDSAKNDIDGFAPIFLKKCSFSLTFPLQYIFNYSLKEGMFLDCWKVSSITPIHKSGSRANISNYRPISKLANVSKIFEHLVFDRISAITYKFLSESQHGFMKNRSTISNLLVFTNFCLNSFETGSQVDTIYFDFCKAFDKVSHFILLLKLAKMGFHSSILKWLESYLANRQCFVSINNAKSNSYIASSGIPQGSVLGPLLFILFLNDIVSCFESSKCLIYADDIKIFLNVKNISNVNSLQMDINRLCSWCVSNHLPLNISKCFHISFGRRFNMLNSIYYINNQQLLNVDSILDLGVVFDNKLTFQLHIDFIMPKAYSMLAFVKRNSKEFTNPYTRKLLYVTFVRSKLEYGSIIWNPLYDVHSSRIERLQKKFLKFALVSVPFGSPLPTYEARCRLIHLETLKNRRSKCSVLFIYKLINGFIDCSSLLSLIGFNIPVRSLRYNAYFYIPFHRSNYSSFEPVLRSLKEFNNINKQCNLDFSYSLKTFCETLDLIYF